MPVQLAISKISTDEAKLPRPRRSPRAAIEWENVLEDVRAAPGEPHRIVVADTDHEAQSVKDAARQRLRKTVPHEKWTFRVVPVDGKHALHARYDGEYSEAELERFRLAGERLRARRQSPSQ